MKLTFFEGNETDCIPSGPAEEFSWTELRAFFEDLAAVAAGLAKGSAGYATACTFLPGTEETLQALDATLTHPQSYEDRARVLRLGYRRKDLVDSAGALVVDYDDRPKDPPDWTAWPCSGLAYSSHRWHPAEMPGKWRVVLELAAPIPAAQYDHVKAALQPLLPPGAILRWAGQPAFLPTCPADMQVQLVDIPGAPLDWRALIANTPAPLPPQHTDVQEAEHQDTQHDARIVKLLSNVWNTTGHRAFGALGGVLHRMGVSYERAVDIAEAINDQASDPHPDPAVRIEEAYEEQHLMGANKLLEALRAGVQDDLKLGYVGVVYDEVEKLLIASVTPPPVVTAELSVLVEKDSPEYLAAKVSSMSPEECLLTWNAFLKRTPKGEIKNLACNTIFTLDVHPTWVGVFGYDEFAHQVVFLRDVTTQAFVAKAGEVFDEDRHPTMLQQWLGYYAHEPTLTGVIKAVHKVAADRKFHPVRQYLQRVRGTWDGVDRNLVDYLGAEPTLYQRAVCSKWLRSAVARATVPGCKADTMLVLEGEQGWLKSTILKSLCPTVEWFYEAASREVGAKDFMADMDGKWFAEIPEVDQLIKSRDESELKALLSRTGDRYRPSYGLKSKDFPRQLVFAGTTNKEDYLRDETGNRRYWPVRCCAVGPIDPGAVCRDRDQIWAQAVAEYDAGLQWWLAAAEDVEARAQQAERMESDPWSELLHDWLSKNGEEPFTVTAALGGLPGALPGAGLTLREEQRMGKVLRGLGYERARLRVDGRQAKMWRKLLPNG